MGTDTPYIDPREGSYYLSGTRVSLASVVYAYQDGHSPESIQDCYPSLTLEQIHGALAFYLGHRAAVEADLAARRERYERAREAARAADPAFYERLAARRRDRLAKA